MVLQVVVCPKCQVEKNTRAQRVFRCCRHEFMVSEHLAAYSKNLAKKSKTDKKDESLNTLEDTNKEMVDFNG